MKKRVSKWSRVRNILRSESKGKWMRITKSTTPNVCCTSGHKKHFTRTISRIPVHTEPGGSPAVVGVSLIHLLGNSLYLKIKINFAGQINENLTSLTGWRPRLQTDYNVFTNVLYLRKKIYIYYALRRIFLDTFFSLRIRDRFVD